MRPFIFGILCLSSLLAFGCVGGNDGTQNCNQTDGCQVSGTDANTSDTGRVCSAEKRQLCEDTPSADCTVTMAGCAAPSFFCGGAQRACSAQQKADLKYANCCDEQFHVCENAHPYYCPGDGTCGASPCATSTPDRCPVLHEACSDPS